MKQVLKWKDSAKLIEIESTLEEQFNFDKKRRRMLEITTILLPMILQFLCNFCAHVFFHG